MKLNDTVEMMNIDDYKERFKAEYYQIKIRVNGLDNMLSKWDRGLLGFIPKCPRSAYDMQLRAMKDYKIALELRALIEGIEIDTTLDMG